MNGDQVPCEFKNLQLNPNAVRMIHKNINAKLSLQKGSQRNSVEQNDIEQISSYDRKLAYFIRLHLRDILTSDHRHVWFNIQTKSIDDIEDRTQILKQNTEEIHVVYSFGSMLSYDTFIGHTEDRSLARIYVPKFAKAIKLETTTYCLTIQFKNIDSQILINHLTADNSIQIIFMLKSTPIIEQRKGKTNRDNARFMAELPLCSDLLVRFYPASTAWSFLRDLPIAGYSRRAFDDKFHINFAMFHWQQDSIGFSQIGMPLYTSPDESYGIEMLWSLGYLFRDKYNTDFQSILSTKQKSFYELCCTIWRNLKSNHCYRIQDALNNQTLKQHRETSDESSQIEKVAFAVITPHRTEYQPLQSTLCHRGFSLYSVDNWLLVHIRDNNGIDKINDLDLQTRVRFRNLMIKGISRGNRSFQYFGSSGSQMNDQAGWFLSLPQGTTIDLAREKIGDLTKIHNVSTYIARVGLYLTTSKSTEIKLKYIGRPTDINGMFASERQSNIFSRLTSSVRRLFYKSKDEKIEYTAMIIPDIERNGFCFTDGCGQISRGLAKKIARSIGIQITEESDVPSAFQVRIAGCKGMLAIDPKSKSNQFYIQVRESMVKFDSDDWTLHVVDHSRPMPLSLNNQIIRLLSDLGNSNGVFESIQTRCIDRKEYWHPPPKSYLNAIDTLDQSVINEKRQKYKNVKHFLHRNKIPLPLNDARCLFGIADETGTLKPGECFIQFRDLLDSPRSKTYKPVEGTVIVTKNPCLHPGDIRKLTAVVAPKLEPYIRDCIVFSTQGYRPNCNEMAGSDLDGDQYWVYWGEEFEIENVVQPLLYPAVKKSVVNRITNELIVDHVLEIFTDKAPGIIANTHKAIADKHQLGTLSNECKECALLFARAIDARKTGEEINLNGINRFKEKYCQTYPAWMMKFDKPSMDPPSRSINEILYQKAKEAWIHSDNYEDILRPLPNAELPLDEIAIDVDETDLNVEQENTGCNCQTIWAIFFLIIVVIVVYVLVRKFKK